ncbi:Heat shock protein 70 [Phytophthora megakarya]|uniref:Heat shock protein 70 n=1 Tax=Phytophthora megakarya TaxID=4795 RepID=A0A225ULT7_9STRA|nr:Heat shock protein 70 [Phytophthora megakarya]
MAGDGLAVAIDVGTTNSLVGVWENDNVTYLKNDNGGRLIPSCVAFTDNECLVGESAKNQADSNAPNTIFGITRLIGHKFSDLEVQKEIKTWSCKVICGPDNIPQVVVRFKGKKRAFYPVEIMAIILAHLRERVKVTMRKKVKNVVLIVPARFNHSQQQAMKDAGAIAGLNVIRLISGPTAASIAYGLERKDKAVQQTVLVYDLGGGTLDVSLVSIEGDIYEVLAIAGDAHFGGEDFDNCLVDHCVEEFKKVYQQDLRANERAMIRLRMA